MSTTMNHTDAIASELASAPRKRRMRPRRHEEDLWVGAGANRRSHILVLIALGLLAFYSVAPVWWLIVSSTKTRTDLYQTNGMWFGETNNFFNNLMQMLQYENGIFWAWLGNSFYYAGVGAILCTIVSLGIGYSISKFSYFGRGFVLASIIGSFLIPGALLTLPLFLVFAKVGLVDTVWAVLIPTIISPFGAYLAKVYIDTSVPDELIEAARLDGAGELRIFWSIVMRLMTTGAATIFILIFVTAWNGFFLPLTMLRGSEKWTLTLGLFSMLQKRLDSAVDLTTLVLMGSLLSVIPLAIFLIATQRFWRSGVTLGAIK